MRAFPFILAVIIALAVFAVFKVLGFLIKFAAVAALMGFVAGLLIARTVFKR